MRRKKKKEGREERLKGYNGNFIHDWVRTEMRNRKRRNEIFFIRSSKYARKAEEK